MQENFRQFLERLRQTGELVDLHQPVDIRHIATLVDQADTALYFHNVIGYHMPVVSGLIRTRERSMMAMGCETYREIEDKLAHAINHPIAPKYVKTSPTRELAVVGVDEMAIAGGLRGAPVELAPCETIDLPFIADAEIVLEAEILPTGWTWPEGRFGEFTRLMGGLHWNPLVRIKAIAMRKDAVYYNLHMPWENTWLAAPTRYTAIRQALKTANVQVTGLNVTLGGCAFWHAVVQIKKGAAGDGKNALLAALSVMDLKHVVVIDDDSDINNPTDVEWAIATRVQGDRDIVIVPNSRAKPLDPSLPQGAGVVPTGTKVGIDATIPEGIPKEHYERITYAYAETAKIDDY